MSVSLLKAPPSELRHIWPVGPHEDLLPSMRALCGVLPDPAPCDGTTVLARLPKCLVCEGHYASMFETLVVMEAKIGHAYASSEAEGFAAGNVFHDHADHIERLVGWDPRLAWDEAV